MPVSSVPFGRRCAAVLLAAAAAVLLIAAPAQAALPPGSGWSTAWRYYAANSFEFSATLPGVAVAGYGTDVNAGLRILNTGAKWSYTSGTTFEYEVRRPSVIVSGYGQHTGNERKAWSTVQKSTSSLFGCSSGRTTGSVSGSASGLTCAANGMATFNHAGLDGSIAVQACHTPAVGTKRCLTMSVSEPT